MSHSKEVRGVVTNSRRTLFCNNESDVTVEDDPQGFIVCVEIGDGSENEIIGPFRERSRAAEVVDLILTGDIHRDINFICDVFGEGRNAMDTYSVYCGDVSSRFETVIENVVFQTAVRELRQYNIANYNYVALPDLFVRSGHGIVTRRLGQQDVEELNMSEDAEEWDAREPESEFVEKSSQMNAGRRRKRKRSFSKTNQARRTREDNRPRQRTNSERYDAQISKLQGRIEGQKEKIQELTKKYYKDLGKANTAHKKALQGQEKQLSATISHLRDKLEQAQATIELLQNVAPKRKQMRRKKRTRQVVEVQDE